MSDETTLLPCPFCGGEAQMGVNKESTVREYFVGCMNCHIRLYKIGYKRFWSEAEAIAAWNTRAELGSGMLTADDVLNAVYKHGARWQAIADELNAELGSGTCEQVLSDCDDGLMPPFTAHCSACGAEWGFTPKFCPNCGRKVVGKC